MISMKIIEKLAIDFKDASFRLLDEGRTIIVNDVKVVHNWINNELEKFDELAVSVQKAVYEDIHSVVSKITVGVETAAEKVVEGLDTIVSEMDTSLKEARQDIKTDIKQNVPVTSTGEKPDNR